jgi:hypothetical protein
MVAFDPRGRSTPPPAVRWSSTSSPLAEFIRELIVEALAA